MIIDDKQINHYNIPVDEGVLSCKNEWTNMLHCKTIQVWWKNISNSYDYSEQAKIKEKQKKIRNECP